MNLMTPTRPARLDAPRLHAPRLHAPRLHAPRLHAPRLHEPRPYTRYFRLTAGPAAAAEARRQVEAAIRAWDIPVDQGIAVLLTSELVTNAITHEPGGIVALAVRVCRGQLRVDVFDTCAGIPVVLNASADAETGRGLKLVATLAAEWGFCRTRSGKAVYFMLPLQPELAPGNGRDRQGVQAWGL